MLKQLQIKNFQSHKSTNIEFSENVNVVIGNSDCGKTAILRALRFAIWNRPSGDAFKSSFSEKDTEVTITTKEGDVITRTKGKENLYQLNDMEFKAFGTDIPKEIQDTLLISEINFQTQFEQPFLLTSTSGEVAQHFNRIAHLEQIDSSIKKVQSWIRDLEQDIKTEEKQIERTQEALLVYANLEQMEVELEVLEGMDQDLTKLYKTQQSLNGTINSIKDVELDLEELLGWALMEVDVDAVLKLYTEKEALLRDFSALTLLLSNEDKITREIALKQGILTLESLIAPILVAYSQIDDLTKQKKDLDVLIERIKATEAHINVTTKLQLPKLQKQFETEMGDECPLCGQIIKHKH